MKNKITIQDLARQLHSTPATVSRALNNHPRISANTKQAVLQLAKKLNYRRNHLATSLRSGKSNTIGVIIPSAGINFFGSVIHGIESIANASGYNILLYQSNESPEYEKKAIESFVGAKVDGIAVKEMRINIPRDLGVIGFANEAFDEHITPSLSSIDQQTILMGREAFTLLLDLINKNVSHMKKSTIILEALPKFRESSLRSG